jgi:hypothetical protein
MLVRPAFPSRPGRGWAPNRGRGTELEIPMAWHGVEGGVESSAYAYRADGTGKGGSTCRAAAGGRCAVSHGCTWPRVRQAAADRSARGLWADDGNGEWVLVGGGAVRAARVGEGARAPVFRLLLPAESFAPR